MNANRNISDYYNCFFLFALSILFQISFLPAASFEHVPLVRTTMVAARFIFVKTSLILLFLLGC